MAFEDKVLKNILKESKLEMPFSDFEDNMMARIQQYEAKKIQAEKSRFYAILSFLLGIIFGAILNGFLSRNLAWISSSVEVQGWFYMLSQLIYVVLIVLFSDKLWKLIKIRKGNMKKLI